MKALVVYDSFHGNTEKIAQAIAGALALRAETQALRVDNAGAQDLAGVAVLVVGSPTRSFRASPNTQEWLKRLPKNGLRGVAVAAFDTRVPPETLNANVPSIFKWMIGYAADAIAKALRKAGGAETLPPEGFFVLDTEGPLKEGELERAAAWANRLLDLVPAR